MWGRLPLSIRNNCLSASIVNKYLRLPSGIRPRQGDTNGGHRANATPDDEVEDSHYTTSVRNRGKLILLGVVIGAILYVLISPLPELAATSTLKLPGFGLILLIVLLIGPPPEIHLSPWYEQIVCFCERHSMLAFTCVRLC
jgi:hypothetical protein